MADYYFYLWKATWPDVIGFLGICLFVLGRLLWKGWTKFKQGSRHREKLGFLFKGIGWLLILGIYLFMLYLGEPDWFANPQWIQGEIQGKAMLQSSQHSYSVEVKSEFESKILIVDERSYRELSPGQKVKIKYLPNRLQVVTCEILP
jgi:hypothetical protein